MKGGKKSTILKILAFSRRMHKRARFTTVYFQAFAKSKTTERSITLRFSNLCQFGNFIHEDSQVNSKIVTRDEFA